MLNDPNEHPGEAEGRYYLFRGAFQLYRNALAHNFQEMGQEESFDLVILANRLLSILEVAFQRYRTRQTATPTIGYFEHGGDYRLPYFLDVDNDGEDEVVTPTLGRPNPTLISVVDKHAGATREIPCDPFPKEAWYEAVEDMVMGDVDNDGLLELVLVLGWATEIGMLFYKYRNGRMELLPRAREDGTAGVWWFIDPRIEDRDSDGLFEVVSRPWESVPADLLPPYYEPESSDSDFGPTGRRELIYRWDSTVGRFALIGRKLLYIGGK